MGTPAVTGPATAFDPAAAAVAALKEVLKPLSRHYLRPEIEEIAVCAPTVIYLKHRDHDAYGRYWRPATDPELTLPRLKTMLHVFANVYRHEFDPPRASVLYGSLPGNHRITAAAGPAIAYDDVSPEGGIAILIRQATPAARKRDLSDWNVRPGTPLDAGRESPMRRVSRERTSDAYQTIMTAARAGSPILLSGATGSGKTSLLNVLLAETDPTLRLVCLEDTHGELHVQNPNRQFIVIPRDQPAGTPAIDPRRAIDLLVRMTPDIVLVSEISTTNAAMALEALSTGHTHFWSTIHAGSPTEACEAFATRTMHSQGDQGLDRNDVAQLIHDRMTIIQTERHGNERLVVDVHQPNGKTTA